MDLLKSMGLEELPEQQTKTMHIMARHPEFSQQLGFDACCTCGNSFTPSTTIVDCPQCQRVSYCSELCRKQDASGMDYDNNNITSLDDQGVLEEEIMRDEQEESAMGHSSIICTLLRLCNNDETVNEETRDDEKTMLILEKDPRAKEAAIDRVRSEFESYPATLANVLLQGPLYEPAIQTSSKHLVLHIIVA